MSHLALYLLIVVAPVCMGLQVTPLSGQSSQTPRPSLTSIFQESGTDKLWRHGYHHYYETKLAPYRDINGLRILEIGAEKGKSLNAWFQYFAQPAAIQGVAYKANVTEAKESACKIVKDRCDLLKIYSLDQSNRTALKDMCQENPDGWDIIIDDGSHLPVHQLISFSELFPKIRPGGLYVIEDIETSYVDEDVLLYGYSLSNGGFGKAPPGNAVEKFKQLVDVVNRKHFGHPGLSVFPNHIDADISEISFGDGLIFIYKKPVGDWGPDVAKLSPLNDGRWSKTSLEEFTDKHPHYFYPE
jgi:hypothetical protein